MGDGFNFAGATIGKSGRKNDLSNEVKEKWQSLSQDDQIKELMKAGIDPYTWEDPKATAESGGGVLANRLRGWSQEQKNQATLSLSEGKAQARIRAPGYVRKYSGAAKLAKQPDETDMYLRALSLMNTQKMMRRSNNPGALGTF